MQSTCTICGLTFESRNSYGLCPIHCTRDTLREFDRVESLARYAKRKEQYCNLTLVEWLLLWHPTSFGHPAQPFVQYAQSPHTRTTSYTQLYLVQHVRNKKRSAYEKQSAMGAGYNIIQFEPATQVS